MRKILLIVSVLAIALPAAAQLRSPQDVWNDIQEGRDPFEENRRMRWLQNQGYEVTTRSWRSYHRHHDSCDHGNYGYRYGYRSDYGHYRDGHWKEAAIYTSGDVLLGVLENRSRNRAMDREYDLENRRIDLEERRIEREWEQEEKREMRQEVRRERENIKFLFRNETPYYVEVIYNGKFQINLDPWEEVPASLLNMGRSASFKVKNNKRIGLEVEDRLIRIVER